MYDEKSEESVTVDQINSKPTANEYQRMKLEPESENPLLIWKTSQIPTKKSEYIKNLKEVSALADKLYVKLVKHIETIGLKVPSSLETVLGLFDEFEQVNAGLDRHFLNLVIYIQTIRVNHLKCHLQTKHMEDMMNLINTITTQRQSLPSANYHPFLEALNDQKDKDPEIYHPCLALAEKQVFRTLLNGLMNIKMTTNYTIKHLEACEVLETLDISIPSHNPGFM